VFNVQYLQDHCQSRLSTADYALLLVAFATSPVMADGPRYTASGRTTQKTSTTALLLRDVTALT
jgi:hypothetical protein